MLKGSVDFIGINHYTSGYIHYTGEVGKDYSNDGRYWGSSKNMNGEQIGPQAESDWLFVYPLGFRRLLKWMDDRYDHAPIYVFENGVSVPGETQQPIEEAIHDTFRLNFYKDYIQNMQDAIEQDGVDVRGYFAWSLFDNFEWADGYNVRFGMVYVDYTT